MATITKVIISDSLKQLLRGRISVGCFHTCGPIMAGGKWREQHGQSRTGTSYGPLTDTPDWSYVDGRPSPALSKRQAKRKTRTLQINARVKTLLKEIDLAKLESEKKSEEEEGEIEAPPTAKVDDVNDIFVEDTNQDSTREGEIPVDKDVAFHSHDTTDKK